MPLPIHGLQHLLFLLSNTQQPPRTWSQLARHISNKLALSIHTFNYQETFKMSPCSCNCCEGDCTSCTCKTCGVSLPTLFPGLVWKISLQETGMLITVLALNLYAYHFEHATIAKTFCWSRQDCVLPWGNSFRDLPRTDVVLLTGHVWFEDCTEFLENGFLSNFCSCHNQAQSIKCSQIPEQSFFFPA